MPRRVCADGTPAPTFTGRGFFIGRVSATTYGKEKPAIEQIAGFPY
jgi:hypothetical protein